MSICIAIIPPKPAIDAIQRAMETYAPYLSTKTPQTDWYIPLVIGDIPPVMTPLRQSFHQTIKILSIGEGETPLELWARIQLTPGLADLRKSLAARMKISGSIIEESSVFVPHIHLGSFATLPPLGIIDTPLAHMFSLHEAHIIQTEPYEILGSIPLTA